MEDDGARGQQEMKEAGAPTVIQDEKTSVVWGMPGEAAKLNAHDQQQPLQKITTRLIELDRQD